MESYPPHSESTPSDTAKRSKQPLQSLEHKRSGPRGWLSVLLVCLPLLVILTLAVMFFARLREPLSARPHQMIGQQAPDFLFDPLFSGQPPVSSQELAGHAHLVNAFASWCVPCRAEHPILNLLSQKADLPIIGFAWKDEPEKARAFLNELGNPFIATGHDTTGKGGIAWGITGVPESWLVSAEGEIVAVWVGPLTGERAISELLPALDLAMGRAAGETAGQIPAQPESQSQTRVNDQETAP